MRTLVLLAVTVTFAGPVLDARAANPRFPYQALIEAKEVYVRSGPGQRFYATSKLGAGDRVVVHRHDPGGWYMIAPPKGSFSWIRSDYVRCTDATNGTVTENNVVVRVGSVYGEVRDVEQRRLSKGDRVTIIAQATVRDERGEIKMFKIAPPAGEYRWISGRFVSPCGPDGSIVRTNDPYRAPSGLDDPNLPPDTPAVVDGGDPPTPVPADGGFEERPLVRVQPGEAVRSAGPSSAEVARERERLRTIDLAFKEMVQLDPTQWNLAEILSRYQHLEEDARTPAVAGAIPSRVAAVKRYGRVRAQYVDFVKLTSNTAQRDAELVTLQKQRVSTLPAPPSHHSPTPPQAEPPAPTSETVTLCGAGIVQRTATPTPGGPTHVLVAPGGRILAWLQPAELGVDLDAHVGRQVGIVGERGYEAALQGDLIEVRELVPVRLAP
jgi:hypothetical protein